MLERNTDLRYYEFDTIIQSAENVFKFEYITYKIVDDKEGNTYVSDVEYSADGKEAVIPDRLWDRIDVNVIEKKAFKNNKNLTSIIINSDKITEVGKQAFKGISTDVTIKIKADKTDYKRIVKLIKKSGISKKVKFERIT